MKKLVFASLLCGALAQLGTGCIIVSSDDDDEGTIDVAWDLRADVSKADTVGTAAVCPPNATAEVVLTRSSGTVFAMDIFDCDPLSGLVRDIPFDTYDVHVNIFGDNDQLIARSDVDRVTIDSVSENVAIDFAFTVNQGRFDVAWEINGASPAGACAATNGSTYVFNTTSVAAGAVPLLELYDCEDGQALTEFQPLDEYAILGTIEDADGVVLADVLAPNETLAFGNETVVLDAFDFSL